MKLNNNDDSHNSGLNLLIYNMLLDIESHPAWVCGLKQYIQNYLTKIGYVTPCVGVWIETTTMRTYFAQVEVTPCVGVWIETSSITWASVISMSHPAWVCGLKLHILQSQMPNSQSHPAWVCGLKRKTSRSPILLYGSHPAWVCGLKLKTYCTIFYYLSHTLRGCVDWNSYEKEIR